MHAMLAHRPEDSYPRVPAPTLVIRGSEDTVCPRVWCQRVADTIPDAVLVEIAGHGHETMIRDAEPTASRILTFVEAA
jgi:pimeloyl-ACP methyl ester carboxylesterase